MNKDFLLRKAIEKSHAPSSFNFGMPDMRKRIKRSEPDSIRQLKIEKINRRKFLKE